MLIENIGGNVEGDRVHIKEKACLFAVSVSNDSQTSAGLLRATVLF